MKKCPKCGKYTVDYDAYRMVYRCLMFECSCIVEDDNSYSFFEIDPSTKTMHKVTKKMENAL